MRRGFKAVSLVSLLSLFSLLTSHFSTAAAENPIALGDDPRIAEAGIEIGVFASGLNFPMGMIGLPDNSLLVATSNPTGGSFFQSTGELLRLTDTDNDGVADDQGTILATGMTGPLVAIQRAGDLIFVTTAAYQNEGIYVLRRGERWRSELTVLGKIDVVSPGSEHQTYGLATRPDPNAPGTYDLFFNAGAYGNVDGGGHPVSLSGLATGNLEDATIFMITVADSGAEVTISEPVQIAGQLRNASTFVFERASGDLIIGENGMDTPGDEIVSYSADEINVIPVADIGSVVYEFGFPETYVDYSTGTQVGTNGVQPVVTFNPMNDSESEGIASLIQLPASFPAPFGGGFVAGFHGQSDGFGDANEENPLVFFDLESGERIELISNSNPEVGHLDSQYASEDALFVADLCSVGSLSETSPCGVIYRVTAGS